MSNLLYLSVRAVAFSLIASLSFTSCATATLFSVPESKLDKKGKMPVVKKENLATPLLPLAVVFDVVTAPIQLAIAGIYRAAKPKQCVATPKPKTRRAGTSLGTDAFLSPRSPSR